MEFWDIYDKDKKPTGRTMKKNDWILKDGEYHLSVLGVIHRPDGRFLITQRVMTKAWAPGWWEVSGGAAQAGESSFTAVCREVKEEVGLDVSQCPGGLAYTYHRENPGRGRKSRQPWMDGSALIFRMTSRSASCVASSGRRNCFTATPTLPQRVRTPFS